MDAELIREYCLKKKQATEGFPFGTDTLVFKVKEKIFLLLSLNHASVHFNIKCNPGVAIELREQYQNIVPGYHMNKRLWNTVIVDGTIPKKLIMELIDNSYNLVVSALSKKQQEDLI